MLRPTVVAASLAFTLGGCCWMSFEAPVCPGSPGQPVTPTPTNPARPIVWDIKRDGKVIGLAYEPATPGPWTIVHVDGVLPFRPEDTVEQATDLPTGVPYGPVELCNFLKDRASRSFAPLEVSGGFDLNAIGPPSPCQ